jgi:hypothetical protein
MKASLMWAVALIGLFAMNTALPASARVNPASMRTTPQIINARIAIINPQGSTRPFTATMPAPSLNGRVIVTKSLGSSSAVVRTSSGQMANISITGTNAKFVHLTPGTALTLITKANGTLIVRVPVTVRCTIHPSVTKGFENTNGITSTPVTTFSNSCKPI